MITYKERFFTTLVPYLVIAMLWTPLVTAQWVRTEMTLSGVASGGVLSLGCTNLSPIVRFVSIETKAGEPAGSVFDRLVNAMNCQRETEFGGVTAHLEEAAVWVQGPRFSLYGQPGTWSISGTETGLGIPKPPTSVSGFYYADTDEARFCWRLPVGACEEIRFSWGGSPDHLIPGYRGTMTERRAGGWKGTAPFTDKNKRGSFWVIGFKDGMYSNAGGISFAPNIQEELHSIPFTCGIAPNWTSWLVPHQGTEVRFKQGQKETLRRDAAGLLILETPADKPFYQIIDTTGPGAQGGTWRHFLGLTSGRTYRLYIRVNTLAMAQMPADQQPGADRDWSFSVHATPNKSGDKENLTPAQFSGQEPLPDGSTGPTAARLALFGPQQTTQNQWVEVTTGQPAPGATIGDITLPAGFDIITVWLRVTGNVPTGVGMDWIKLEDITPKP